MPVKPARRQRKCCQETRSLDKRKRQTSRIWLYRIYITISHITDYSELLSVLSFVWTTDDVKVSEKELPGKRGRYCDIMAALRTGGPPCKPSCYRSGPLFSVCLLPVGIYVFLAQSALQGKPRGSSFIHQHEKSRDSKIVQIWGWIPALQHDPGQASEFLFLHL